MKKQEKARIKLVKENGAIFLSYPEYGVTLLLKRTGKDFGRISWAICSKNDTFKKRVGKIAALDRYCDGGAMPIRARLSKKQANKQHMHDCFDTIARTIS